MNGPKENLVVLFGALRSGTTLVRLILDAHPKISCPGERDFMFDFLSKTGDTFRLDHAALTESRIFLSSGLDVPPQGDGVAAFEALLAQDIKHHEAERHILVLHRHLDELLTLRPDVKVIHLVRDPRDVAHSSIGMGWAGNTWFGVDHWIDTETEWDRQSDRFAPDQVHLIHYETMLRAPKETLKQVFDFIGVPFDPQVFSFSENSTYDPLDASLAEQWRSKQTPEELADVEYKIGDLLTRRGYQPSGFGARRPTLSRKIYLAMQNRAHIWRHRFQRFGFSDPIADAVTRRLGLQDLGRGARARIRAKEAKYLK